MTYVRVTMTYVRLTPTYKRVIKILLRVIKALYEFHTITFGTLEIKMNARSIFALRVHEEGETLIFCTIGATLLAWRRRRINKCSEGDSGHAKEVLGKTMDAEEAAIRTL